MIRITVQCAVPKNNIPTVKQLTHWAKTGLSVKLKNAEMTIRIVDKKEIRHLNQSYRKKKGETNILSFPLDLPNPIKKKIADIGDIVICADVVNREARDQGKSIAAHWAHMVIHGTLHLLGFDHQIESDAVKMESREIKILNRLGFPNPYR